MGNEPRRVQGYELLEKIGEGSFGEVYRARQLVMERDVAIKILRREYASRPDFIRNFEAEAKLVARLEHPHIVPLYDYWRDQEGAFLVMKYVLGGNLNQRIERGQLDNPTAERLLNQLTDALSLAHYKGIVHRDLKPANILVSDEANDLNIYLTDFGIARPVGAITNQTDEIAGTYQYMSPQHLTGEPPHPTDDIFSLGIMLYEILAGEHPFAESSSLGTLVQRLMHDPLPDLCHKRPDLPPEINKIIQRATAKNLDDRYADVRHVAEDFRRMLAVQTQELKGITLREPDEDVFAPDFNPYRGLQPFDEVDSELFFGREVLTQTLIERLKEDGEYSRFLAVVGPSGSGKTSVVHAGLIPVLRAGNVIPGSQSWFIAQMTPGSQPVQRLAAAMVSIASNLPQQLVDRLPVDTESLTAVIAAMADDERMEGDFLLVIDKLEELFTQVENDQDVEHFLRLIQAAITSPASRLRVIAILRADFYYRPLLYADVGEMMLARTQIVPVMSRDEIEEAIVRPAKLARVTVDASLVSAIINDVTAEPGMLPLLQYALAKTFDNRVGRHMTLDAYRTVGGVTGALSRSAEEIYLSLNTDARELTRQIFLNLVRINDREKLAHRRARRADLVSLSDANPGMVNTILNRFEKRALLIFDSDPATREPTVEVVHEALFANWTRLSEWIEASREDLYIYDALNAMAEEWESGGKDPHFEVTARRLEDFEALAKRTTLTLMPLVWEFLHTMKAERDRKYLLEEENRRRVADLEYRSLVRARLLATVLLVATVIALILTAFAMSQRDIASNSSLESESLILAFNAKIELIRDNTSQALALAQAAVKRQAESHTSAAVTMLTESGYAPGLVNLYQFHAPVSALAVSPDGHYALAAVPGVDRGTDNFVAPKVYLWPLNTLHEDMPENWLADLLTLQGQTGDINDIAFSPDGLQAATASDDGSVMVWNLDPASDKYGSVIQKFDDQHGEVLNVEFSPDGTLIAYGGGDTGVTGNDARAAYTIHVREVATGVETCALSGSTSPVLALTFGQQAEQPYLLSGSGDAYNKTREHRITQWDLTTCAKTGQYLDGHTDIIQDIAMSADGTTAVSASADYTVRFWDLNTFRATMRLNAGNEGHTDWVNKVAISPDGKRALSGAWDSQLILWDAAGGQIINHFVGHEGPINGLAFIGSGAYAVSASEDGTVRLWQTVHALHKMTFDTPEPASLLRIAYDPVRRMVGAGASNGQVYTWILPEDALTGDADTFDAVSSTPPEQVGGTLEHEDAVYGVAFDASGRHMLSGGSDQRVILWDIEGSQFRRNFEFPQEHRGRVWMVAFYEDKSVSGGDKGVIVWDNLSHKAIARYDIDDIYMVAFTPDGKKVVAGGKDTKIHILNLDENAGTLTLERDLGGDGIGHTASINTVAFSRDGHYMVTGGYDNTLIVWDMQTYTGVMRLEGHTGTIYDADFSPDGQYIYSAAGSGDNTVRVWNRATGEELARVDYGRQILSAEINTDQNIVLIGSENVMELESLPEVDLANLQDWIKTHRYVPALDCDVSKRLKLPDIQCE